MRSQSRSMTVGIVMSLVIAAGCFAVSLFKPQPAVGEARIIISHESGALFVRIGDTLHPALNLASARLIVAAADTPTRIKDATIARFPRGPMVGIIGAPGSILPSRNPQHSYWSTCDATSVPSSQSVGAPMTLQTMVIGTQPTFSDRISTRGPAAAFVVSRGGREFVVFGSHRAEFNRRDQALARSLWASGTTPAPRPMSGGLFDAISEVPPLQLPPIAKWGKPTHYPLGELGRRGRVGTVFAIDSGTSKQNFIALESGIQAITNIAATYIRNKDALGLASIPTLEPSVLNTLPRVSGSNSLPLEHFPHTMLEELTTAEHPVVCLNWGQPQGGAATVSMASGNLLPLSPGQTPVAAATADGSSDGVDLTYIPAGSGEYVKSVDLHTHDRVDGVMYIADTGVRYTIRDANSAGALGLTAAPKSAPWQIIAMLKAGPALSQADALFAHDAINQNRDATAIAIDRK